MISEDVLEKVAVRLAKRYAIFHAICRHAVSHSLPVVPRFDRRNLPLAGKEQRPEELVCRAALAVSDLSELVKTDDGQLFPVLVAMQKVAQVRETAKRPRK